jgi:tetratricopeptide (TPR) repeat protein
MTDPPADPEPSNVPSGFDIVICSHCGRQNRLPREIRTAIYRCGACKHPLPQPEPKNETRSNFGIKDIPYPQIAALISIAVCYAAEKCADMGNRDKTQYCAAQMEFLAFYCTVACNEVAVKINSLGFSAVLDVYKKICTAFYSVEHVGKTYEKAVLQMQAIVWWELDTKHEAYFKAYWNGSFKALMISDEVLMKFAEYGYSASHPDGLSACSAHAHALKAFLALVIRNCQIAARDDKSLPPAVLCAMYYHFINGEVKMFVEKLRSILQIPGVGLNSDKSLTVEPAKLPDVTSFSANEHSTPSNTVEHERLLEKESGLYRYKRTVTEITTFDGRWKYQTVTTSATKAVSSKTTYETASSTSLSFTAPKSGDLNRHFDYASSLGPPSKMYGYGDLYTFSDASWLEISNQKIDTLFATVSALHERWKTNSETKNWEAALNSARDLAKLLPGESEGWEWMAFALHELERTQEALNTLLDVVAQFPNNHLMRVNLACYECSLGNLPEAKKWLKEAKNIAGKETIRGMCLGDSDLIPLQSYIKGVVWL